VLRLKTRSQFQAVLAGSRLATSAHFAVHFLAPSPVSVGTGVARPDSVARKPVFAPSDVCLGSMVPKRWAKRAVTRNAIKRQVYQVAGEFEPSLPKGAFVVRLRTGFDKTVFASASSDVLKSAIRSELLKLFTNVCQARTGMSIQGLVK
jgi:ribonuclease P protein component